VDHTPSHLRLEPHVVGHVTHEAELLLLDEAGEHEHILEDVLVQLPCGGVLLLLCPGHTI
jgi:hypothetical protein